MVELVKITILAIVRISQMFLKERFSFSPFCTFPQFWNTMLQSFNLICLYECANHQNKVLIT
jgi:hypothetical protein